jgi:hypothetical protein
MIRREKVRVVVDDATIAAGQVGEIIQPVWWLSTIYNGPGMYEESLKPFSRPQRLVRALLIYMYEVNNGGHKQFFSNSAGLVWRDAMDAFQAIGLSRGANILTIAGKRLGGDPSLDRGERQEQLELHQPDFSDLDEALAELRNKADVDQAILKYIREQPSAFYFSGMVERVVLPRFR